MMRASLTLTLALLLSLSTPARAGGVVSSATPEATTIGAAVLEQGGNAVDAAIAISLALGVSEPAGSGLAGQTAIAPPPFPPPPRFLTLRFAATAVAPSAGPSWSPPPLPWPMMA
jgi:hypothetical protein